MATNPSMTELAIRDIARHALAAAVRANPPEWENYPDLCERDWAAVLAEVDRRLAQIEVQGEKYGCAYRHLAERADASEEAISNA